MKKLINKKWYDTTTATQLGVKYVGEFGQADGYEELLFITKFNQHFIYGNGGPESKYVKPTIELCTGKEATEWLKANEKDVMKAPEAKNADKQPVTKTKEKTRAKPRKFTPEDKAFIADKNNPIEAVMEKYGYDKESAHKMRAHFKKRAKAAEDANIE